MIIQHSLGEVWFNLNKNSHGSVRFTIHKTENANDNITTELYDIYLSKAEALTLATALREIARGKSL